MRLGLGRSDPGEAVATAPLTTEAYVWQQRWTPEVRDAVVRAGPVLDGLCFQLGQINAKNGRLVHKRLHLDWPTVGGVSARVRVAWRIHAAVLKDGWNKKLLDQLTIIFHEDLAEADRQGVHVVEAQVDLDCPERLLDGYADLMAQLRSGNRQGGPLWTFTALPSWLKYSAFRRLGRASDGFVLQVHWLRRSPEGDGAPVLMRVAEARRAVEHAARTGVPFRVALPAYGSAVVCDAEGRWLQVVSEEIRDVPAGLKLKETMASPEDCLQLLGEWRQQRPAGLTGVVWYRLPVDGDLRCWSWRQFQTVVAGQVPAARFEVHLQPNAEGCEEVQVRNIGTADAAMPRGVKVSCGRIVAADGLFQYRATAEIASVSFDANRAGRLAAGTAATVGWLRREAAANETPTFAIQP